LSITAIDQAVTIILRESSWDTLLTAALAAAGTALANPNITPDQRERANSIIVAASNMRGQLDDARADVEEQLTIDAALDGQNAVIDTLARISAATAGVLR
jgi:hypothetical protein